jgi:hypothetical protein
VTVNQSFSTTRHLTSAAALICALVVTTSAAAELGPGAHGPVPTPHHFQTNGATVDRSEFPLQLVIVGDPPEDVSLETWSTLAEASAAEWSSVPCSYAAVDFGGHRDSSDELEPGDVPVVANVPACTPEEFAAFTAFTPCGGFPARTIFLNTRAFDWSVEPKPFQELDEGGIPRVLDLESAMTHELGHVLGLSHSNDRLATMYASYRPDGSMRSLALDDKLGMCSLYEADEPMPECSDARPCPDPERCTESDGFTLCEEFRGGVGDQCGLDQLVCVDRCALVGGETGYCTEPCESAESCPDGFDCVDGFLGADNGAFCARIDTNEPPRGCCSTGVSRRPSHPTRVLLLVLGLCVVCVRRRISAVED